MATFGLLDNLSLALRTCWPFCCAPLYASIRLVVLLTCLQLSGAACSCAQAAQRHLSVHAKHAALQSTWLAACLQCAEMSWKRGSHAMAVAHNAVWAVGGWDASSFLDSVEVFEPHMNTWRTLANMHAARAYGAAAAVDGTVYAMWGMKDASHNDMVEQYDPQTNSWQVMTPPDSILQKRAFVASCVIDML